MMDDLDALAHAFHGVTLEYRRSGHDWPLPWRCRIVATKNERSDFRITGYGETAEEAVTRAVEELGRDHVDLVKQAKRLRGDS